MNKCFVTAAAFSIAIAISLGALSAHALEKVLSPESLDSFKTAVTYQFYASFGMLMIALNQDKFQFSLKAFFRLLTIGMILFSGSIYLLSTKELHGLSIPFLGPITPIGGLLMIIAWLVLAIQLIKRPNGTNLTNV